MVTLDRREELKKTVIPAGYRVTIESWENDADNQLSTVVEGLRLKDVLLIVALCEMHGQDSEHSNLFEPTSAIVTEHRRALTEAFTSNPCAMSQTVETYDQMRDLLGDLLGHSDQFYTRVFDSLKVEYLPADVELEDVTDQFWQKEE